MSQPSEVKKLFAETVANLMIQVYKPLFDKDGDTGLQPHHVREVALMVMAEEISFQSAKKVLEIMHEMKKALRNSQSPLD